MLITGISHVHRILKLHAFTYLLPALNSNQLMEANYRTCLLDEFVGKTTLCQIFMLLTSCVVSKINRYRGGNSCIRTWSTRYRNFSRLALSIISNDSYTRPQWFAVFLILFFLLDSAMLGTLLKMLMGFLIKMQRWRMLGNPKIWKKVSQFSEVTVFSLWLFNVIIPKLIMVFLIQMWRQKKLWSPMRWKKVGQFTSHCDIFLLRIVWQ